MAQERGENIAASSKLGRHLKLEWISTDRPGLATSHVHLSTVCQKISVHHVAVSETQRRGSGEAAMWGAELQIVEQKH